MTDYRATETQTPPVLRQSDGKWYVEVVVPIDGVVHYVTAPVGRQFARQVMERMVLPKLDG